MKHQQSPAWLLALLLLPLGLASCSEKNAEDDEFANWQSRNDTYFASIYRQAQEAIQRGDTSWKIIRTWSMDTTLASTNCIVARVVAKGTGSGCPLYTDSALVDYKGSLIPSASYPAGYVFDQSWYGDDYVESSARPAHLAVKGVVDGFATALQNMHIGDNWIVYIPYQLGYGSQAQINGALPAYSVLVFDLHLRGYYRAGTPMPNNRAKGGLWIME